MRITLDQLESRYLLTAVAGWADTIAAITPIEAAPTEPAPIESPITVDDPAPAPPADPVVDPTFAAPTLTEGDDDGSVHLIWAPVRGAQSYSVQRSDNGTDFYDIGVDTDANTTSACDFWVQPGMRYAYRIVIPGDAPVASASSSIVTSGIASPDYASVSEVSETQIVLDWSWSGASSGVTYTVQRALVAADGSEEAFQTIASGLADAHFVDTTVTAGAMYDYHVIATADGQESAPTATGEVAALGVLDIASANIDSHVDPGQSATLRLAYDIPPGGGNPAVVIYWGDGTLSDTSDPATTADIKLALSEDGKQMIVTATHQYTTDDTCYVCLSITDGTKQATQTPQELIVAVGTGQWSDPWPIFYDRADGGVALLAGSTGQGVGVPAPATGATDAGGVPNAPWAWLKSDQIAAFRFNAGASVFGTEHGLFDAQAGHGSSLLGQGLLATSLPALQGVSTFTSSRDPLNDAADDREFLQTPTSAIVPTTQPAADQTQPTHSDPPQVETGRAPAAASAAPIAPAAPVVAEPTTTLPANQSTPIGAPGTPGGDSQQQPKPQAASMSPVALALLVAGRTSRRKGKLRRRRR